MILDSQLLFSDNQVITATAVSTNKVDLGLAARDIGVGEDLNVIVQVTETFTDASSNSTVTVDLVTDADPALGSPNVLQTLVIIPALAAAGTRYVFKINPKNLVAFEQYIGLRYTLTNGDLSTGKITAAIVADSQLDRYFASGY